MNQYKLFYTGIPEPTLVSATSYAEAEQAGLKNDRFHPIEKIELVK